MIIPHLDSSPSSYYSVLTCSKQVSSHVRAAEKKAGVKAAEEKVGARTGEEKAVALRAVCCAALTQLVLNDANAQLIMQVRTDAYVHVCPSLHVT